MFNGYHEPSATSYNDLELDRGKKNQGVSKWACGNGASIQSNHVHPQNQQSEVWVSKQPFIGLPNTTSPKCNCPSCYQLPESQSYQGEIPWHRSWFSRTYPVSTHDLVKLPGNHQWENAGESYPEQVAGQFVPDGGEKPMYYKPYSGLRHEIYQPGVISTVKKVTRKQDLPKQDEVMSNVGHHARYSASLPNPSYESFRTAIDQRLMDERTNYCNQNEKFINVDSCRQQGGLGPYGFNSNRRTILESFSKTVPSNTNQNRVPSVGHRNIKDNGFHPCIEQNDIGKIGPYVSHGGTDEKLCKTDVNFGQENLHAGLMNAFSSTTDYQGTNLNREFLSTSDKDFQKFGNGIPPQYFPRNNISDVINRSPNTLLNYDISRKGVINIPSGSARAAQTPPKHEIASKAPNFGKECIMREKMSPGQKLMNNNVKIPSERFLRGNDTGRSENILHGHMVRPIMDTNLPDKGYHSVSPQNSLYKGYRRPQEYSYPRRNIQRPYDNPNGLMNIRGDMPMGMNQGVPNFSDVRKGLDAYPRVSNAFPHNGSPHQFEKLHYQLSDESKPQSSLIGSQFPQKIESIRETEKENPGRISYLEAIPYEELCKNGTSKISPLRLLRKKKLIQHKEDVPETSTPDTAAKAKNSSPPLDVRRFWATWAEEEEDNVPQTQMVVLDCNNIDAEQAGLLHLYNPESIRTVNLESGNVLDIKGAHFEKGNDQNEPINGKEPVYGDKLNTIPENERLEAITSNQVKIPESAANDGKIHSAGDFSLGAPLILDPVKEVSPDVETKTNVISQPNHFGRIVQNQPSDDMRYFDELKYETKPDDSHKQEHSEVANPVLIQTQSDPNVDEEIKGAEERKGISNAVSKEESVSSYSSDDSQTGDLLALPDLPTSEYRKNKFLDYSEDGFCNGGLLSECKEIQCRKPTEGNDCQVDERIKDFLISKPSEISPGNFEVEDILKKLSDINFQGVATGSPLFSDSPDKHKTDKKILESRKEKKAKKQSHKSSHTDQVTLQNISLTKPTIKFSIQKSHDLKISFKVLNNKKKHEENSDEEDDAEDNQGNYSPECVEDGEITDRLKKNKRRLITLKLKGVSEGNDDGNVWDEESARKSKKGSKKKKVRWDKSPSPKTPVLKIKKSRYMTAYGCESEETCNGATDDASKSSEGEGTAHGNFQVHETVDSAKIKLTFKRNRIEGDRKDKCFDSEDVAEVPIKATHSEDEFTDSTDSCLKSVADLEESPNDCQVATPREYPVDEKEDPIEVSSNVLNVKRDEDSNIDFDSNESGSQNCDLTVVAETPFDLDEDMIDDFKKEDIVVEPLDIVNSCVDGLEPEEPNSPPNDCIEMAQCQKPAEIVKEDTRELKKGSQSLEVDILAVDGEKEEVEKNAEESQVEVFGSLSKRNIPSKTKEVGGDRSNEENCAVEALNRTAREPLMEEIFAESTSEENIVKTEEAVDKPSVTNAVEEDEKNDDTTEEQACFCGHQDAPPQECREPTAVVTQDGKLETADTAGLQEVITVENSDGIVVQSEAEEPLLISDALCDLNLDQVLTESVPEPEPSEQYPPEISHIPEHPTSEVDTKFLECDNRLHEIENLSVSEMMDNGERAKVEVNKVEVGVVDMDVEGDSRQQESCKMEQNWEPVQSLTKETVAEDNQINEKKPKCQYSPKHTAEDKNNNVRLCRREAVFVKRDILRRHSYEQETNKKRVTSRSTSLNIELPVVEGGEPEIAVLDINVSDIPLPSGEAPLENCLNFEEYFKSKQLEIEAKDDVKVKELTAPQLLVDVLKPISPIVQDLCDIAAGENEPCDAVDGSVVREEIQQPRDELATETAEKVGESMTGVNRKGKEVRELSIAEEIQEEDLGVFDTRDVTLENSFRADQLYECEGLPFDEALTITDDMEEEKVSDDDKFRNIMQNCLDNAKKFLSVGNLKLLSCSVDDLLQVDNDTDLKRSDSHVSKDVLLTSCEERDDLILPNSRNQSLDLSDFVPSFFSDVGSNPCSEILPVDNWPYLEEEVASSPLRNRTEDSDVLCCLSDISSTENFTREFPVEKLKRQRRVSLQVDSKRRIAERRRTIEGIHRWKSFRSTDEVLSNNENIILNGGKKVCIDKSLQKYDKNNKHRAKPYSDSEGMVTPERSSADYKSSSWQPRVVLFRISKNNPSMLPNKSSEIHDSETAGKGIDRNYIPDRYHTALDTERQQQRTDKEKPTEMSADRLKRKKNRFRNLHTKKRTDQTKENKSTAYNSNLVDSGSDSEESSPSSDPPKEIVLSHSKSTKPSNEFPAQKDDVSKTRKPDTVPERSKEKRKRDAHEVESRSKRKKSIEEMEKPTNLKYRRDSEKKCWVCEVCGFSKSSERATHIQSHPFHCQSCHLAFKTETNFVEHLTRKHKDIRNQHHCLLCELSFDLEKDYYRHLETREHKHLESVEKNTINTLFRLLTGHPCPVLGQVESKPEWLPTQAGTVHFYHQATPLSLALQYLNLHRDKKKLSSEASE